MFKPGSVLRYEIFERVGVGGMAEVFRADALLQGGARVPAVLKKIRPHHADDPDFRSMFLDEATITAHLDHPGIVRLLDVGRIDDTLFLAFELVEGVDLRRALETAGTTPMDLPAAIFVTTRVLDALDYAHRAVDPAGVPLSIVHRDVSSANVLLSWKGDAKLSDFGLARARVRAAQETAKGRVKGNLYFLAPEQITQRGTITALTDVYQAGMLLLRALSGKHPFEGVPLKQVVDRILTGDLPVPSFLNPKVPREIDQIIADALRARPESRYPSASDFAFALRNFAEKEGVELAPVRVDKWLAKLFPDAARSKSEPRPQPSRVAEPVANRSGGSRFKSRELDEVATRVTKVPPPESAPAPPARPAPKPARAVLSSSTSPNLAPESPTASRRVRKSAGATTEAIPMGELYSPTPVRRLQGHMGSVNAVVMAVDGKRAVTGGDDATVRVWRPEGASRLFEGHEGAVTCVATAGGLAVSGSHDGTVRLWDLAKGKAGAVLHAGALRLDGYSPVLCTAIDTAARRIVAGTSDGTLRIWSGAGGAKDEASLRIPHPVTAVTFAGDGPSFWSGDAEGAIRTHGADGSPRVFVDGLPTIRALASGGNHLVAACADHRLRVWKGNAREPVWTADDHLGPLTCVAISADGSLALSGAEDGVCRLWHLRFQKPIAAFSGHEGAVLGVAFTADLSWIVSAGTDGDLAVWRLTQ